ncbi:hypothetical protein Syun_029808 [Stephania yunnanensis]|uniref:Rho termination factor-like N-terminal domain-containing protein n=1 Tax=Stephania yunnanensis TaxID=152371 RepID=A0AAP0EEK1_9MAGN
MSQGLHFLSTNVAGYQPLEGKCFHCSGVIPGAITFKSCSDFASLPHIKVFMMKSLLSISKRNSFVCPASSSGNRKNPDFSRQNKQNHGFSRNRNRQNPDKVNSESLEDSEILSSKNGPLLSLSNTPRYQATATPGPREKEIVELFRKVQAQLRERAAMKEEKKIETSKEQGKESETVDSLLKLLRKHSVEQGKRRSSNRDTNFSQLEQNSSFEEEQTPNFFDTNSSTGEDTQDAYEPSANQFKRPVSNFRRRSPVPRVKYQPVYASKNSTSLTPSLESSPGIGRKIIADAPPTPDHEREPEPEPEPSIEPELESYSGTLDAHDEAFDELSESEHSDIDGSYNDEPLERPSATEQTNLLSLKLVELRAIAKSRGLKGYSKVKKSELIEMLSGVSN